MLGSGRPLGAGDTTRVGGDMGGGANSSGGDIGGSPEITMDVGREAAGGELAGVCVGEMTSPGLA